MKLLFLPLVLDKFQICCVHNGGNDATSEYSASGQKDLEYYLGACDEHKEKIIEIANKLSTSNPYALHKKKELEVDEIFVRLPGHDDKCKFVQWDNEQKNITEKTIIKKEPKVDTEDVIRAVESWQWITNVNKWMSVEGKIVSIQALSQKEFIGTALAIFEHNFERSGKKRKWLKSLLAPSATFVFPSEEFDVGPELAGDKLDEFREIAKEKGWI